MASRPVSFFSPGEHIGEYEIIESLGVGGMGAVYKVRHLISHRIEALKVILPNPLSSPEIPDRFLREIRLLASLQHKNIAVMHNAFRHEGRVAMAMEFVEGVSLREKLKWPGITLNQGLGYASQILEALSYAHSRGVIHRDVKPSNVMVQLDGVLRLLDFGLATAGCDPELTLTGTVLGSPYYMSPEQARGEKADALSDIYSAGAVLYEICAGRPPFHAPDPVAIVSAHLYEIPKSPIEWNPHVPSTLSRVVLRALAKDPKERIQTAKEFLSALETVLAEEQEKNLTETVRPMELNTGYNAGAGKNATFTQSEIEQASKSLALYIGPIAQIIVKRAAANSRSLSELYQIASREISSAHNRERFLDRMPRPTSNR